MIKISVIIPIYNAASYLEQCLDSLINQTLREIEIICVDDGSTDQSLDILTKYAQKDARIRILKQQNLYAGAARNHGLSLAQGEYIHFLDSDDWVDTSSYEQLYNIITAQNVDIIKFKSFAYDHQQKAIISTYFTDIKGVKDKYFNRVLTIKKHLKQLLNISDAPWSGLYKLSFLKEQQIQFNHLRCSNDTSFYYECILKAAQLYLSSERFVYYRINNEQSLIGIRPQHFHCQLDHIAIIQSHTEQTDAKRAALILTHIVDKMMLRYRQYCSSPHIAKSIKKSIKESVASFLKNCPKAWISPSTQAFLEDMPYSAQISIILPVYLANKELKQCLISLISQSFNDLEIICIDASPRGEATETLLRYAQDDSRFTIIHHHEPDATQGAIKNLGISQADGKYISLLGANTLLPNNYYQVLHQHIESTASDISLSTSLSYLYNDELPNHQAKPKNTACHILNKLSERQELILQTHTECNKLYRSKLLKQHKIQYTETAPIREDPSLAVQALLLAKRICYSAQVTAYLQHPISQPYAGSPCQDQVAIIPLYHQLMTHLYSQAENKIGVAAIKCLEQKIEHDLNYALNECEASEQANFILLAEQAFPFLVQRLKIEPPLIVSLTSQAEHIYTVHQTIETLLNQSKKAQGIILWLSPESFQHQEADLPPQLIAQKERGLIIDWYKEIGEHKRLIPTLKKYPQHLIVTVEDQLLYPSDFLHHLYKGYQSYPRMIQATKCQKALKKDAGFAPYQQWPDSKGESCSYSNCFSSQGGVLYPPHSLHPDIMDEELATMLAPNQADIWSWSMAILKGTSIHQINYKHQAIRPIKDTQSDGIEDKIAKKEEAEARISRIPAHYPELLRKIKRDVLRSKIKTYLHQGWFALHQWRLYKKVRLSNGKRRIYLCGIKIFSYTSRNSF